MYQMVIKIPNGNKRSQMFIQYSKWQLNISTFSNIKSSKIYPNWDFSLKTNHLATLVFPVKIKTVFAKSTFLIKEQNKKLAWDSFECENIIEI
jgi:hypothetical protein